MNTFLTGPTHYPTNMYLKWPTHPPNERDCSSAHPLYQRTCQKSLHVLLTYVTPVVTTHASNVRAYPRSVETCLLDSFILRNATYETIILCYYIVLGIVDAFKSWGKHAKGVLKSDSLIMS